jgi:SAM-dependent methyltransferase
MQALMRMINGFRVSQAIHVATVLGIADLLRDGPRDVTDLASACDADPEGLYRLLRALSAVGVFEETVDRTFAQSSISEHLRTDSIASAAGWARLIGQEYFWSTWGQLALGIKTGKNVFPQLYDEDVWSYRARDPALSRIFDDAMTSMSSLSSRQVIEAFDFSQFSLIVDIAGGKGRFLTDILTANPDAHGILFDQPHVVTDELLKTAGVADRAKVVGGSFFEPLPPGGDAYILMAIIHDWEDAESNAILNNVREAIAPDGKLLLVERVVEQPNAGPMTKFSDLNMLVLPGGRERTEEEFGRLYEASGFRMERIVRAAPDGMCVVEGIPI